MNTRESEFGARRMPKLAMNALVLALAGALSACATKGPAGSAAGAGNAKGSAATAAAGSAAQGSAGGAAGAGGNGSSTRAGAATGAGGAAGGGSGDPFDGLVSRNSNGAADHLTGSSVSVADGAGGNGRAAAGAGGVADDPVAEAIRRDQAARAAAAGAAASGGASKEASGGAGKNAAGGTGKDAAGSVAGRDGSGRSGSASGGSHKSGTDALAADDDDAATGGDPVKRALRQAEKNRQAAAAGGAGAGGTGPGGAAGAGAAGSTNAGAAGAGAGRAGGASGYADDSPVARALRQAEAAEAAARERERLEAEARRGRVETAANSVLIDQDDRLQTLGGMLPMALNMDEQGLFDFDRYQLRDEVKKSLDEVAEKLKTAAYDKLHILGFTDRIGTEEYNRRLSEKRAWAVAGYLMNKGVPPHKLRVVGRGEEGSVVGDEQCEGLTREAMIECLQRDRRVEIAATVKEYQLEVR